MYLSCGNQDDLIKLGRILTDRNGEVYVIIGYNLCQDTYYTTIDIISMEEYNELIKAYDIEEFETLRKLDYSDLDDFEIVENERVKVNKKTVYNFS